MYTHPKLLHTLIWIMLFVACNSRPAGLYPLKTGNQYELHVQVKSTQQTQFNGQTIAGVQQGVASMQVQVLPARKDTVLLNCFLQQMGVNGGAQTSQVVFEKQLPNVIVKCFGDSMQFQWLGWNDYSNALKAHLNQLAKPAEYLPLSQAMEVWQDTLMLEQLLGQAFFLWSQGNAIEGAAWQAWHHTAYPLHSKAVYQMRCTAVSDTAVAVEGNIRFRQKLPISGGWEAYAGSGSGQGSIGLQQPTRLRWTQYDTLNGNKRWMGRVMPTRYYLETAIQISLLQ